MSTRTLPSATYSYVQTKEVVSDVVGLLQLDQSLSGTDPSSIYIARQKLGTTSLLELKGIGKHLWKGLDAQDYIDNLRDEWN